MKRDKRKILFVDDEQKILDSIRAMLHAKRKEWKCRYAQSSAEAVEILDKEKFDVVIADMRMPGMDGADVLKYVEEQQPGAVRMILSGYSEMSALLKSVKHAHQFLSKPCSSEVIIGTIQRALDLGGILHSEPVRTIVTRIDALPALPELFVQVTRELQGADPDLKRIAQLVAQDVGLTATLMKVVNSSFFGFYEKVSSPARAVTLLGIEALKGLILGAGLLGEVDVEALKGYSVEKLWDHSLKTGYYAKIIATSEGQGRNFVDNCFIAGTLHDVGKLVFAMHMDNLYRPVVELARREGGPIVNLERQELDVSHAEVGAYLLGLWGFDREVVEGVFNHHSIEHCSELCVAMVTHIANAIQHELEPGISNYTFSPISKEWLERHGLEEKVSVWREACLSKSE